MNPPLNASPRSPRAGLSARAALVLALGGARTLAVDCAARERAAAIAVI